MDTQKILNDIYLQAGPHKAQQGIRTPKSLDGSRVIYSWIDKYSIMYDYDIRRGDQLTIKIPEDEIIPISLVWFINNLPREVKSVKFINYSSKKFDELSQIISTSRFNRQIYIDANPKVLTNAATSVVNWPSTVKLYNPGSSNYEMYDFDFWCLNLNEEDFDNIVNHCDEATKNRVSELRDIVKYVYTVTKDVYPDIDSKSNREKADLMYELLKNNIEYDAQSTEIGADGRRRCKPECGYANDPIQTFRRKKGICTGRSGLLKSLLNNYYMKVPCFITKGYIPSGDHHAWNEVVVGKERIYYDISFNVQGAENVNYRDIDHSDYYNYNDTIPRYPRAKRQPKHRVPYSIKESSQKKDNTGKRIKSLFHRNNSAKDLSQAKTIEPAHTSNNNIIRKMKEYNKRINNSNK